MACMSKSIKKMNYGSKKTMKPVGKKVKKPMPMKKSKMK